MNKNIHLKYLKALIVCFAMLHITGTLYARKARVLFIGNSYTYFNNLPEIVANIASSTGDTLVYDMCAYGGAAFYQHLDNTLTTSLAKIKAGGWDYVVLQEQSQMPAYPPDMFNLYVYGYAKQLVDSIKMYNPCAETIFYMTWGRKNGDSQGMCVGFPNWPHFCTYNAMDSVIRERYMLLADSNKVTVSPVGAVWRYIRGNYPGIELYDADNSHPSSAGSYAGACSFYTAIFQKPADSIKYNFSLSATDAANIRTAAGKVVYDSISFWHIGQYKTIAGFSHSTSGMQPVSFTNKSLNASQYDWNFGDGQTSTAINPTHNYTSTGSYTVRLVSTGAQCSDTSYATLAIVGLGITDHNAASIFTIAPNPVSGMLYIRSAVFTKGDYRMQILNSLGQLVYQQSSTNTETQSINVSGITSGIYILNVSNANKSIYNTKITIQ